MAKMGNGRGGFFDLSKAFGDFRSYGFHPGSIAELQRKNVEALTQANQLAVEGMRALAQRQTEIVQESFGDASALWRDLLEPSTPEDRMAKQAELAKHAFEKGVSNARELSELGRKATADVFAVITRRVSESFDEMQQIARRQAAE
jgi:phasin family protein